MFGLIQLVVPLIVLPAVLALAAAHPHGDAPLLQRPLESPGDAGGRRVADRLGG